MTPTVWLVRSNTNPMLFAFATKDAANDYIAGHPASIAGGMYATEVQVFGGPAPSPDDVALVDELIDTVENRVHIEEGGTSQEKTSARDAEQIIRTALFARLRQRDDVIEECARVARSYEPKCDTCPSGVENAILALKGK